jgi:hypothetical protein
MTLCDADSVIAGATYAAAGVTGVGRYFRAGGATAAELSDLTAHGVAMWGIFEQNADNYQGGFAQGAADARAALAYAPAMAFGSTVPIYFTVDTMIPEGSESVVGPYFQGIGSVIPVAMIGAYAQGSVLAWLLMQKLAAWFWLSESTSYPGYDPSASFLHLVQSVATPPVPDTDLDLIGAAAVATGNYGQFPSPTPPTNPLSDGGNVLAQTVFGGSVHLTQVNVTGQNADGALIGDLYDKYTSPSGWANTPLNAASGATGQYLSSSLVVVEESTGLGPVLAIYVENATNGVVRRFYQPAGGFPAPLTWKYGDLP